MYLGKIVELADGRRALRPSAPPVHRRAAVAPCRCPTRGWRAASSARSSAATCPSPTNPPPACRFHTRCPKAVDGHCNVDEPLLERQGRRQHGRVPLPADRRGDREAGADARRRERRRPRARGARRGTAPAPTSGEFPEGTRTAVEAAAAVGCEVGQICKSLVFRVGDGTPLLVIASGVNRVDEARFGGGQGRRRTYVRDQTGFAIGGVPPVGHARAIDTVVDEDLLGHDVVWAAAGHAARRVRDRPRASSSDVRRARRAGRRALDVLTLVVVRLVVERLARDLARRPAVEEA